MKVFKDIINRDNVVFIAGNHDFYFAYLVSEMGLELSISDCTGEMIEFHDMWLREGGIP